MNEKGFTLIEMLIVLMVISVLLLVAIPNITKHNGMINDKGCEAFLSMVQAQVKAYEMEHNKIPTVQQLLDGRYIKSDKCPNGHAIKINENGDVSEIGS
ncbi:MULTISPECIES: competence type IV pilus major pilin ComGC [Geobacillus]|jgi:competence protein ComGC|uniref:ComG operon protein 3 n=2 Tax=Geobacillus thermodenitrificans TaxID=33940 RepID=A4IQW3_GEOTN|nr:MULTISPECIES: competence type IV pilus major pilin ComGC [Geobacillus]ABO67717.1 ComG operon protein 3 [Geobacillus thermodenitrificans NG80-2]ARP43463.1 competence protein ComGC [Geobacillus thermodenitrificans]ATO38460.1 competence protein ComG [Geobacillus thermodenitrificans]KQB92599.1 putative membrane protein [Geobacillus sp. PA-3]MED3904261.1 competence type IV pilus major pilin ComGC [Geobacillus thermodenitrificans]